MSNYQTATSTYAKCHLVLWLFGSNCKIIRCTAHKFSLLRTVLYLYTQEKFIKIKVYLLSLEWLNESLITYITWFAASTETAMGKTFLPAN